MDGWPGRDSGVLMPLTWPLNLTRNTNDVTTGQLKAQQDR
jgi:hypothetical protein